ncbi:DUF2975 domain-containing protein [Desulfonema magnum]|uniref:DUF2975 n=1 Tax=Desulfonema magnum TaxID=45655 RepID=A0A975GLT8_9BACT|nr:DUF2975 domain-containing protein [Desulfonema magnum]QTA85153.1 DUF2975 [Desulfonema magnum]
MDNLSRVKKISKNFHLLLSFLLVAIPLYYVLYWAFINYLPETLITVNTHSAPLIPHKLPIKLQFVGFITSLLPLSALTYGLLNIRKLFSFYKEDIIFSFEHVSIFKNISKALLLWVLFSVCYESAKSVLFSAGNPPGSRVVEVGFGSAEITTLMVGGIVRVIAWVMDEGRILTEEKELTI